MKAKNLIVAQRSRTCRICKELTPEQIADVNGAIWPVPGQRVRNRDYRTAAVRIAAAHGLEVEVKSVTRHATHVERSWHQVTGQSPQAPGEIPVFATDFNSMVDRASGLGAHAMETLSGRIPEMDSRDLVSVAKLGMAASATRESLRLKAQEVDQTAAIVAALGGLASGHITEGDIPEAEVINVTPPEVLLAQVQEKRARLERLASGEDAGAG